MLSFENDADKFMKVIMTFEYEVTSFPPTYVLEFLLS